MEIRMTKSDRPSDGPHIKFPFPAAVDERVYAKEPAQLAGNETQAVSLMTLYEIH